MIPSNVAIRKTGFMATIQSPVMPKKQKIKTLQKVLTVIRLFFRVAKIKHIK
jgi:hypothetical protein